MKDTRYNKSLRTVVLLMILFSLLIPAELYSENYGIEIDIGASVGMTCPDDIVQNNDSGLCSAVVTYTPPANAYLATGQASGTAFPVGITFNKYVLNDDSDSCTFTVTVVDAEAPIIENCPDDILQSYDDEVCQQVFFDTPTYTDNCVVVYSEQVSGPSSGSVFPIGSTLVEFVAKDAANNISTCSFYVTITGGHSTVLQSDGSSSEVIGPQGKMRYQRAFYLIKKEEMEATDLENGMEINTIGFTIGLSQNIQTTGNLKVYLENTTDLISRIDDDWTTATVSTNTYDLSVANPGPYEWQVRAVCSGITEYSELASFENDELGGCNIPYNLSEDLITESSALLSWELPMGSTFDSLLVIYGISLSNVWDSVYTTDMSYMADALFADTNYQWGVMTICGGVYSELSASSFSTVGPDVCDEPSSLVVNSTNDTAAVVSWTPVDDSSHYNIAIRRAGTSTWITGFAFNSNYTFYNLESGTTYEWKVSTSCYYGSGSFVEGPDFSTSGTTVCYVPEDLKTSSISGAGAVLSWLDVPGAVSYELRYRLKESISWYNAKNTMTLVSEGTVTIPDTIGQYDIPFEPGNAFTYNGNGVYVAWEYSNTSNPLSTANISLCTEQNTIIPGSSGLDSLIILSFSGKTDTNSTALPPTLRAINLRPETRLGSLSLQDSVEVTAIYTLGYVAMNFSNPVPVSAMIKNFSDKSRTYSVTLEVFDKQTSTLKESQTKDITVPGSCGEIIAFQDLILEGNGIDSLVVSIPGQTDENVIDNNSQYYIQKVNDYLQSYADDSPAINGAGFGTGEGLILSRYTMNGCGKVNGAKIFMHYSAAGNSVYAVLLDASGNLLDESAQFSLDSTEVNNYHSFFFPNAPLVTDDDYYIGLAQIANASDEYYPVGVQWESNIVRETAYYRANLDGSSLVDHPYPGRLMIKAEIIHGMPVPFIGGSDILCDGSTNTLQATSKTIRFADAVIDVSSEFSSSHFSASQALGSPDVYPEYNSDPHAWISQTSDGQREFIELHFPDTSKINFIDIYQTFNPGAIDTVYLIDSLGTQQMVYSDTAREGATEASIMEIRFPLTSYRVVGIRIELSSDSIPGFHGIDAVGIGQIHDPAVYSSYSWSPGGETTSSINVGSPGTYELTVSSGGSCSLTDSIVVETPIISTPAISLSGPSEFCLGDTVTLTSSEAEGNTWSTGETTQSIYVVESGTFSVTYNNGCETATSSDVVVTVNPLPVISFSGGPICPGGSATISVIEDYSSYLWSTGETTQSIEVYNVNPFQVIVSDNKGCVDSSIIVTYYAPAPYPVISGDPNFCPGDSSLLDAGSGYSSYIWSTGATSRTVYVSTPGAVSVTVSNDHGCIGGDEVFATEYTPPSPFISGSLSLCFGSATILDAGEGYVSYLWSTGENTSSIVVYEADTYMVEVTDVNGCKGSTSATTNMDGAIPDIPGPITGPTGGICMQSGLVYSISPVANTTHYDWKVPDGITIVSGQGSREIVVNAGIISSGIISVAASNTCGQSPTWNGRYLEVHGSPDTPGEITGPANGVCGLSGLTYSVNDIYGSLSYTWTVPDGAVISSGAGTSEITVSYDATFISGKICVSTVNACGESGQSCLQVKSKPAMPTDIVGPIEVCRKEKNVVYSVDPVFNADNYIWTVPLQASIKSGQGTSTIVVNFGNKAGYVSVQTENDCGLSGLQSLEVGVVPCDNGVAIIIEDPANGGEINDDPVLNGSQHIFFPEVIASAGEFFQGKMTSLSWTLGESVIETVKDERMMLSQGFHQSSYDIITIGGSLDGSTFDVELYPVPTRDNLHIHISSESEPVNLVVEIYDLVGNVVYKENVKSKEFNHMINLYKYSANLFVMKVTDIDTKYERNFKIIKVKL